MAQNAASGQPVGRANTIFPRSASMNYRHIFHAGNFADVIKHVALVSLLLHLRRKEKPFCVIDCHAGRGLYDLKGEPASRTREADAGIAQLRDPGPRFDLPDGLRTYLDCVEGEGQGGYPGSPRLAARLLRPQDRLIAIERHPEEAKALAKALAQFPRASAIEGDACLRLPALLPPRERRGLVLIDPPYEAEDEFMRAADLLARAHRRFATGIYLLWFPIKSAAAADAFCGEIRTGGIAPAKRIDIDIGRARDPGKERLSSAGLLIVNPPFGFEAEMDASAKLVAPHLGRRNQAASITIQDL
jgi:23S rRNA (adenine2030-N6)-methyltransferase